MLREPQDSPDAEKLARSRVKELWRPGDLFHNFSRFPTRTDTPWVDRLPLVLQRGLVPSAQDTNREVYTDVGVKFPEVPQAYEQVVFLHKFGPFSDRYIPDRTKTISCLIHPDLRVYTPQDMGADWPVLSRDEVYYKGIIPPEMFIGIVVSSEFVEDVRAGFQRELSRLAIPLYDFKGRVYWPA